MQISGRITLILYTGMISDFKITCNEIQYHICAATSYILVHLLTRSLFSDAQFAGKDSAKYSASRKPESTSNPTPKNTAMTDTMHRIPIGVL